MQRSALGEPPQSSPPAGFRLRTQLVGHTDVILRLAWSPDGRWVATPSVDTTIRVWDAETGECRHVLTGHAFGVNQVAWSPDGNTLASVSFDRTIRLWDVGQGTELQRFEGQHADDITTVAWSADGRLLASGSTDRKALLWSADRWVPSRSLSYGVESISRAAWSPDGYMLAVGGDGGIVVWKLQSVVRNEWSPSDLGVHGRGNISVTWSPDGRFLASAGSDRSVRIWDGATSRELATCEGHVDAVTDVAFSSDGRVLGSRSRDGSVRLWRSGTWDELRVLQGRASTYRAPGLAFHPSAPVLATVSDRDKIVQIWELDLDAILSGPQAQPATYYANAKVVLLGDSGVGKSGLGLVLSGQPFAPTESTHGRRVWVFETGEVQTSSGDTLIHETLLWDLAGQPGYRLVHQLHLAEVAVAVVVFDSRSDLDPFAGVRYWDRALRQARRTSGESATPMKKLLVAARADRNGVGVSRPRLAALMEDLGFDAYFETSARAGWGIPELAVAIRDGLQWSALPRVSSNELFQRIKAFLVAEKQTGSLLSTSDDLFRGFLRTTDAPSDSDGLRAEFETCIRLVESRDLIRRLSFGGFVLLQPELLDAYASSMVNAAYNEPDGLGSIPESIAREGRFPMSADERITNRAQEELLLIATVEDLLRHELALREQADDGPYLVFPSQLTRERPDLPDPPGKAAVIAFEGPILNVYTTLAVRLSHSGVFTSKEFWRTAAEYRAAAGGTCGLFLRVVAEGSGELTLFFDSAASPETRLTFERYVRAHLERRALTRSIRFRRTSACPECGTPVPDSYARARRERGFTWMTCGVCNAEVQIGEAEELFAPTAQETSSVVLIDRRADAERDRATAATSLAGKQATADFDVFLCHNSKDKPLVKAIAARLKERGLHPWLDVEQLPPGVSFQQGLERSIRRVKSAAVFVGANGIGPWQRKEQEAFLIEFLNRNRPVIPVILPGTVREPKLPIFLRGQTWVDFRADQPDPLERLVWGITGEQPRHVAAS